MAVRSPPRSGRSDTPSTIDDRKQIPAIIITVVFIVLAIIAIICMSFSIIAELAPDHMLYSLRAEYYMSIVMVCIFLATLVLVGVDCWVSADLWNCHCRECFECH
jgi:uncharacterized membrane protein